MYVILFVRAWSVLIPQAEMSFVSFLISTVGITVLYLDVQQPRGSVLLAYLFHAAANTCTQVFSIDHANPLVDWVVDGLPVPVALIVILSNGAENLSRIRVRIQE